MVAAGDAEQEDADEDDECPYEAGDGLEGASELLNREGGRVDGDAVHSNWYLFSKCPCLYYGQGGYRLPESTRSTSMNLAKPRG